MPITRAKRNAVTPPDNHLQFIRDAIENLRGARNLLRAVGSKKAADYAARALKSAEGAERHAQRMTIAGGGRA